MHPQILADQLILSQPEGIDCAHQIITGTSGFVDLPTALIKLIMFYKKHCTRRISLSFSKFHSCCLAVAYFPPKKRLVLLLNFFIESLLIFS